MNCRTFSTTTKILAGEDKATTATIRKGGIKRLLPERAANQQSLYHECRILTTRPHRVHSYLYTSALKLNNQNKTKAKTLLFLRMRISGRMYVERISPAFVFFPPFKLKEKKWHVRSTFRKIRSG